MDTLRIKEEIEDPVQIKEENPVNESYRNSFQCSPKKEIPLLVFHDLAGKMIQTYTLEDDASHSEEDVPQEESDFDDGEDSDQPLDVELNNDIELQDSNYPHEDEGSSNCGDGNDPLFIEEQDDSSHVQEEKKLGNFQEQNDTVNGKAVVGLGTTSGSKIRKTKPVKQKQINSPRVPTLQPPVKEDAKSMSVNNVQKNDKKDLNLTQVRKSKRKVKKNVLFCDSFVTNTSEMFESANVGETQVSRLSATSIRLEEEAEKKTAKDKVVKQKHKGKEAVKRKKAITSVNGEKSQKKMKKDQRLTAAPVEKQNPKKKKQKKEDPSAISIHDQKPPKKRKNEGSEIAQRKKHVKQKSESIDRPEEIPLKVKLEKIEQLTIAKLEPKIKMEELPIGFVSKHPKPRNWVCEYCPESFTEAYYLRLHIMHHTNERPYKCDICNKGFRMRWRVKLHRLTHTDEKPFRCTVCGFRCNRRDNLLSHMSRCHLKKMKNDDDDINKTFKCHICSKGFAQKRHLNEHVNTHSDVKPFHCQFCDHKNRRRDNLMAHMKARHPNLLESSSSHFNQKVKKQKVKKQKVKKQKVKKLEVQSK